MLRSRLGDEAFFRGLKIYYDKHKNATATTEDLRAALEKASGKDLKEFFASWVYGIGHPRYEISITGVVEFSGAGSIFHVTLKQLQPGPVFLDPVPFEVTTSDNRARDKIGPSRRLWIQPTGKETTVGFRFIEHETPKAIQIDPDGTLLKEVVPPDR
jgi:aminopeptidase N